MFVFCFVLAKWVLGFLGLFKRYIATKCFVCEWSLQPHLTLTRFIGYSKCLRSLSVRKTDVMLACQELCFLISTFPEAHFQELYMPFPSHAHHKNWRYSCIHNNERINGHLCTHGQQKQRSRILSLMHWSMNVNPATCKRALQIISVACELCGIFCHVATLELVCNMATEAIKLAVCWKPSIHIGPLLYFLVQKCTNIRLFRCLFFSVVITLTRILLPISFFFSQSLCRHISGTTEMPISFQATNSLLTPLFIWVNAALFQDINNNMPNASKMSCSEVQQCSSA